MVDFSNTFSNHLKAAEVRAATERMIADAWTEEFQQQSGGTKVKLVLAFRGTPRTIVCNATSAKSLAAAFGNQTENLKGRRVRIEARPTNLGQAIFVTPVATAPTFPQPVAPPAAAADAADDEIDDSIPW
jgi:hypothetical protein